MKKLVFTALAIVAFSGAGMAKTKKTKTIKNTTSTKAIFKRSKCDNI